MIQRSCYYMPYIPRCECGSIKASDGRTIWCPHCDKETKHVSEKETTVDTQEVPRNLRQGD